MTIYVLGFAFDDLGRVAMIEKKRPDWQAGLLNGVGGHVESNEDHKVAMSREFTEETGVIVGPELWLYAGWMRGNDWSVYVYTFTGDLVRLVHTVTDERVILMPVHKIQAAECIENIPALIALCTMPLAKPSMIRPTFELNYYRRAARPGHSETRPELPE